MSIESDVTDLQQRVARLEEVFPRLIKSMSDIITMLNETNKGTQETSRLLQLLTKGLVSNEN